MNCKHIKQNGGIISWCGLKNTYCDLKKCNEYQTSEVKLNDFQNQN